MLFIIRKPTKLVRSLPIAVSLLIVMITGGCERTPEHQQDSGHLVTEPIKSPVPIDSIVPQVLKASNGDIILSWLEPLSTKGYAFRMAIGHEGSWSDPRTVSTGEDICMFQGDLPGVAEMRDGSLLAYWQLSDRTNGDRYATTIRVALSKDGGLTWSNPMTPYQNAHPGQHGFISAFPVDANMGLIWLDAEQQQFLPAKDRGKESWKGAIGLRYASVNAKGHSSTGSFIDPITCECCPTAAAVTARGPVVVYRGRREPQNAKPTEVDVYKPTVRDIQISRLENGQWTRPRPIFNDNWVINGCPDNGPAVDAAGNRIVVAWWTGGGNQPSVKVAFSSDAGDTFSPPIRIDNGAGAGQVTVTWTEDRRGAVVGWLEKNNVWARLVSQDGSTGPPVMLGSAAGRRLPKWVTTPEGVLAVWTMRVEDGKRSVRVARLKLVAGTV
jgi:hypothetical protein